MLIEGHTSRHWPVQVGGDVQVSGARRWVRFAAYFGEAPGSNTGFWRTRWGTMRGWNLRIGPLKRCLTLLVHTRPRTDRTVRDVNSRGML